MRPVSKHSMAARVSTGIWIGIGLVVGGIATVASIHVWAGTRTFVPVEMPVSLGLGHIRTGPFRINLRDRYTIQVNHRAPPDLGCDSSLVLTSQWTLYRNGQVFARSPGQVLDNWWLGSFDAERGTYELDIEILRDASCLDPDLPRLYIAARDQDYDLVRWPVSWLGALVMGTGLSLLVITARRRAARPAATALPARRGLPSYSLCASLVLSTVIIVIAAGKAFEPASYGLPVRLSNGYFAPRTAGLEPILVRLALNGRDRRPDVFIGDELVPWEDFESTLWREVTQRPPTWPVYFEGDGQMEWRYAAEAIDRIRALHPQVVLIPRRAL